MSTEQIKIRAIYAGRIKNPREAAEELNRIAKANRGELTPEKVVENAQSNRSPLHDYFTWDDTEAARKCRLIEASNLIRSIKVTVETHPQDPPKLVRAFINVRTETDGEEAEASSCYVPLRVALNNNEYRKQMLLNAAMELTSFRRKYSLLNELSLVVEALDMVQERLNLEIKKQEAV
jgi:hypothetical protein